MKELNKKYISPERGVGKGENEDEVFNDPQSCQLLWDSQIFSMSSVINDDIEEGWCIDTDGLNFGISRNERYVSCQFKAKETIGTVKEKDCLYPLRNSFRHSYVNTNSDEDPIERQILNSACLNVEKKMDQGHRIPFTSINEKRRVCNRSKHTTQYFKKKVRIGIISMTILLAIVSMSGIGFYFYDRFVSTYVNSSGSLTSKNKISMKPNIFLDESYSDDNKRFTVIPFGYNLTRLENQNISSVSTEIKILGQPFHLNSSGELATDDNKFRNETNIRFICDNIDKKWKSNNNEDDYDKELKPISAHKHKPLNHSKLDYGLMSDLSILCNMVVSYVDKTKHIVRSKQTNDIYELARDIIRTMERVIQVKFDRDSYSMDDEELHPINNYEKLLRINGAKLCNQYQRFNAWVNVYRHLPQ